MKFQLTIEGDSPAELYALVDRMRGSSVPVITQIVPSAAQEASQPAGTITGAAVPPAAPARKRAKTEAPAQASTPAPESAAPASPPSPAPAGLQPAPTSTTPPVAADPAKLTEADARKALKLVNDTVGLGMEACREMLLSFEVQQISLLPKDKYAAFIAACSKKVDDHKAAK